MLDLNRVQANPDELKDLLKKRCVEDISIVDKLNEVFANKKKLQAEVETLRAERNKVSKEIGITKSKGGDITEISNSMKLVGDKIKELEESLTIEEEKVQELNLYLPNYLDDVVPYGKSEEDNLQVSIHGIKKEFSFVPKTHFEIGEDLKIIDFERGVKISGSRAYTYFGKAAKLERALMNFMLDIHSKENGYEEVWVPVLVNDESMKTTGQYPKFKDDFYRIETDNLNLIPTAEVSLTNLYRDEILPESDLPISIMAHTSCFRREAGSHGRDTRGIIRVHQFQKIELVKFTKPEESETEHQKLLKDAESILQKLNLHYKVLLLCSKDTSSSSSKTFDLEVWMPGLNRFLEISSVSNFKDFQSRRGKIRYKGKDGKNHLLHTINGSGLAIGRTLAAILENYQTESGDFEIPDALKKYFE